MGIKDFAMRIINKIQNLLEVIASKFGIKESVKRLFLHLVLFITCFFSVFCIYFTIYLLVMPRVHQSADLNFQRTDEGYKARILNYDHSFPICRNKQIVEKKESDLEKVFKKICADPLASTDHGLIFEPENYSIKLILDAPSNDLLDQISILPVGVEFINKKNEVIESEALGNVELRRPGPIKKLLNFIFSIFGISSANREINVVLSDKFANEAFDLIVINLQIPEAKLLLNNIKIEFKVILTGLRRIMYDWFWTCCFFSIGFWTLVSYGVFAFGIKAIDLAVLYLERKNQMKPAPLPEGLNVRDKNFVPQRILRESNIKLD